MQMRLGRPLSIEIKSVSGVTWRKKWLSKRLKNVDTQLAHDVVDNCSVDARLTLGGSTGARVGTNAPEYKLCFAGIADVVMAGSQSTPPSNGLSEHWMHSSVSNQFDLT